MLGYNRVAALQQQYYREEQSMDFEALKKGIAEISTICKDVPEAFQAKCFERLLEALLEAQRPPRPSKDTPKDKDKERGKEATAVN
jgi:hypothetical protein